MKRSTTRGSECGFALVGVLIVMMLLMAVAGAMHVGVLSETRLRGAHARATAGFYAAEAGINRGMGDYRNLFMTFQVPDEDNGDFAEKTLSIGSRTVRYRLSPAAGTWPAVQPIPAGRPFAGLNSSLFTYVANATSEVHAGDIEVTLGTQFNVHNVPLFQFLAFYQNDLEINPGPTMTLHGPIHTNGSLYFNSNNTLRIEDHPPSGITTVSVTAAGDIYRGRKDDQNSPKCGGTVRIDMLTDTTGDGWLDDRVLPCGGSGTATKQTEAMLAPWLGSIRATQPAVAVPEPSEFDVGGSYFTTADLRLALDLTFRDPTTRFHRIVALGEDASVDATATDALQAFLAARPAALFYNDVPLEGADAADPTDVCVVGPLNGTYCHPDSYDPPFPAVPGHMTMYDCGSGNASLGLYPGCNVLPTLALPSLGEVVHRRGGFYNNREGAWVYMLNLNLHDLLQWNRANGGPLFDPDEFLTHGGIVVYMTVLGPNSTGALPARIRYGVRVYGSPNLDFPAPLPSNPNGVTVISDQAIYVEGNYNLNTGNPGFDANFPKQPAAFMGDTINVLSAGWSGNPTGWGGLSGCRNDCQSRKSLNGPAQRPAATTYINAAFLGGVDETQSGSSGYNGGFENFPRFHERWTSRNLVYRGSFVSLGTPQRANGAWCGTGGGLLSGCNIYDAPGRAWDFDTDFINPALLPPATPTVVSVEQILFTENFR